MVNKSVPVYEESQTSLIHSLAWLPIPLFIIIIFILALLHNKTVWSPHFLIPTLNIAFLSVITFFVSILAARSFIAGRSISILLLGCGTLALGLGGVLAGFSLLGNNVNSTISIYNTAACLSGVFILASVLFSLKRDSLKPKFGWPYLLVSYLAIFVLIYALVLLIQNHIWPIHFIQGSGQTFFGLAIIYITIALFAISAILLLVNKAKSGKKFRYWYGLGLGLIAVGLFGVSIQLSIGDPLNWVGRISQYLGAVYILIAVISTIRQTGVWMLPWERALQESEEKYQNILDNIQDAYFRGDNEGIIIMASPSAARMYGFDSPKEMIGLPALSRYKNKEDRDFVLEELNKHGKLNDFEVEAFKKDGTSFWVSQNAQYYYDNQGQIQGTEAFVRDITERKKAEKIIHESEEKFRSLYSSMTEGVAIHNVLYCSSQEAVDYVITDVNPAYENIIGLKRSEVIGKKASELYGIGKPPYMDVYSRVAESGEPAHFETYFEPMDKHFRITVTSPDKGKFATIFEDISERKKAEEDLRKAHDNLEIKVKERTKELEEAINELKRSNKELESFAYITSHDLQEPLRSIASYSQLIKRRYEGQLDSDADEFIDFMVIGATRMKQQIQGLLDYSRVGTQGEEFKEFNSEDALNHALDNLQSAINDCHAEVTHENLPVIIADENQITRVFQNLIGNALKFHKEGVQPIIQISAGKTDNEHVFSVSDNGIGIEPQYKERIFEVFKRLHAIGEYEGTGIGLAIVKRIIERHHGRVWVESDYGFGSTFYFTIPTD